ncbi:MAG: hypothetical protein FJ265_01750 [Planctomycetes bacterium]|nr:hypothetical protein [Planctomycetota bacterium]
MNEARQRRQALLAHCAELRSAADRCAAAAVLVQGDTSAEVEAAQTLALAAMSGEPRARRIAAEAFDRLRWLAGKPQKFGLVVVVRDGVSELWPVEPGTTDSERAKWDVPPLADLRRSAAG